MSDETTRPTDDVLEQAPVEDYSGDDTQAARGAVKQPSDDTAPAADSTATEQAADATEPPAAPSRDG
jgi:hypothetical protein